VACFSPRISLIKQSCGPSQFGASSRSSQSSWSNGPVKGLVAATAFAIPSALAASLIDQPLTPSGGWWFVSAELALLFGGVGILLDHNALRRANMPLRQLGEIYQITSVRSALAYLSPLAALLFAVVQQLTSGDASSSVQELVNNASAILPRGGH
jgi:hypothetical protein